MASLEGAAPAPAAGRAPGSDPLGRWLDRIDRLSFLGGWLAAICVLAILALIVAEVLSRNVLNISLSFAWEYCTYFMGAAFMLGAGYALRAGAQIRVHVLLENLPRPLARACDIFATLLGLAIAVYLSWALSQLTWLSLVRESRSPDSETPLWIPQITLALGAVIFALQLVARTARLLRGEPGDDARLRLGQDIE
jgi:C4-dicarboxylate transporter DctQ subunit